MDTLLNQPRPTTHELRRYTVTLLQNDLKAGRLVMFGTYNVERLRKRVAKWVDRPVTITFIVDVARSVNVKLASPPRKDRKKGLYLVTFTDKVTPDNVEEAMVTMGVGASQAVMGGREAAIGDLGGQIVLSGKITVGQVKAALPPPTPIRSQIVISPERMRKIISDGGIKRLPAPIKWYKDKLIAEKETK